MYIPANFAIPATCPEAGLSRPRRAPAGLAAPGAVSPAATMTLIVGPAGPVLALRPDTPAHPAGGLFYRLSEAEARRLAGDLTAWLARRDASAVA
jgi:hypothetical protein